MRFRISLWLLALYHTCEYMSSGNNDMRYAICQVVYLWV